MHLERADGGDDHDRGGVQSGRTALQVEELLAPEIERETRLRDGELAQGESHPGREHRIAPVRDVGERAAVYERGSSLARLDEVRQERIIQNRGQGAGHAHLARLDGLPLASIADQDAFQTGAQVGAGVGQAEDRHDLAGRRDVEARLARNSLPGPSQAEHDLAQRAIVHVERAFPQDMARVERRIAEVQSVVDHGGQQVVRGGDRVEVAGELKVDLIGRFEPARAAAGRPPLAAEHRPHRRLPQRQDRPPADLAQPLRQADRDGRLPLAGRRRGDRRHEDQHYRRAVQPLQRVQTHLGLVAPIRFQEFGGDPQLPRDLGDRSQGHGVILRHIRIPR